MNFLRMDQEDFDYLLELVHPDIEKKDTNMREAISASQRLSITLRYLESGMDLEDLKLTCAIAPQNLEFIIMETCSAITKALKQNIQITEVIHVLVRCAQLKELLLLPNMCVNTQEPQLVTEHNGLMSKRYQFLGLPLAGSSITNFTIHLAFPSLSVVGSWSSADPQDLKGP
ncbi:hypothetical protein NQ318_002565 [Aromia moschata]|uniref:BTB/POZ domain-containing protein n=1 Tax=Aromia moschata TaxID=1265417 RepID=A0AAV8Y751_9CUCU|nr:hypothetical protein NQ318_002565 [Aromia moschata]